MTDEREKLLEEMAAVYASNRKNISTIEKTWSEIVQKNPLYRPGDKVKNLDTKGVITGFRWAKDRYEYFVICLSTFGALDDYRGPVKEDALSPGW